MLKIKSDEKSVINIDPEIMGGTPVFRGTRTPIQVLFDYLRSSSIDDFLRGYPQVSREMVDEVTVSFSLSQNQKASTTAADKMPPNNPATPR